jgi:hypothetical protein
MTAKKPARKRVLLWFYVGGEMEDDIDAGWHVCTTPRHREILNLLTRVHRLSTTKPRGKPR